MLNVDMLIYILGSFLMAGVSIGFVVWGLKSGQFHENDHLKRKPLEGDEEENDD